jgi:hypothetical protein
MHYSTGVIFAVAKILNTLTRLLKPLGPAEKLQVLQHVTDTVGVIHRDVTASVTTKGE